MTYPETMYILIAIIALWTILWKGVALWRAAKNGSKVWFIILLLANSIAILEIIYIYFFSKKKKEKDPQSIIG